MKTKSSLSGLWAVAIAFAHTLSGQTHAATYSWESWSFPSATSATVTTGAGTINLSVSGPNTNIIGTPVLFAGETVNAPSATPRHSTGTPEDWSYTLDFSAYSASTSGIVLALGNFAHDTAGASGYQLSAFDSSNTPISLTSFLILENKDYTFPVLGGGLFNDPLSLDAGTGLFSVATVSGGNDINSNMLLMTLPPNVDKLTVSTIAPFGGDSVSVMLAVPEPSSALLGLAAMGLMARRRR